MKKNVRILLAALIVSLCMGGLTACGKTDSGQLESGKSLKEGDVAPGVSKGRFVCLIFHIENTVLKR